MWKILYCACFPLFLASSQIKAQSISLGVIGGVSPGPDFYRADHTVRYPAGATLEFGFGRTFALEVDGIYRYQHWYSANGSWQVPVLAKHRFHWRPADPFLEAGPSLRTVGVYTKGYPAHLGVTAGVGVAVPIKRIRLEPTIRYTHWGKYGDTVTDRLEFFVGLNTTAVEAPHWAPLGSHLAIGALLGVPLIDEYRTFRNQFGLGDVQGSGPRSLLAGAAIELRIVRKIYLEADGFHRPLRAAYSNQYLQAASISTTDTWQFLTLAKVKLPLRRATPFAEIGPTLRIPTVRPEITPFGLVAGVGVEKKWGPITVSPRIRISHWSAPPVGSYGNLNQNEVVFMTGISVGGGPK